MPLIAVLSLVLLFLGHSTLAGITGLIFALLFLAGFRHQDSVTKNESLSYGLS